MSATILAFPLARCRRRNPMTAARDVAVDKRARRVARLTKFEAEAYCAIMIAGYHPQNFASRWGLEVFPTLDRAQRLEMLRIGIALAPRNDPTGFRAAALIAYRAELRAGNTGP